MHKRQRFLWSLILCLLLLAGSLFAPTAALAATNVGQVSSLDELAWRAEQLYKTSPTTTTISFSGVALNQGNMSELAGRLSLNRWEYVNMWMYTDGSGFGLHYYETDLQRTETKLTAQRIVNEIISKGMSTEEKYRAIYTWLAENVTYGYPLNTYLNGQSAYEALVVREAVCAGIARGFMLLSRTAGLECFYVSSQAADHAWNVMLVGDELLYADATWAQGYKGQVDYSYFLLPYDAMAASRAYDINPEPLVMLLNPPWTELADYLNQYDLFKGSGSGYNLSAMPTRDQAATMFCRLLGYENEAMTNAAAHSNPFTDVPDWAAAYVSILYEQGLTKGISADRFGSDGPCTLQMYLTFLLRAMGYTEGADFTYDNATAYAINIGLLSRVEADAITLRGFTRNDMVLTSYRALQLSEVIRGAVDRAA